nr:dihydrolipoyl dehydrogenase [FCB group bacterium]
GPGGYAAAFRTADLGKKVVLIEKEPELGGVCLNRGCIPSKALLHLAKVLEESSEVKNAGIVFGEPEIDVQKVARWKDKVVGRLNRGVSSMAKMRKVEVVQGTAVFKSASELEVKGNAGSVSVIFENCIIAAGSSPSWLPFIDQNDPDIMDSTAALEFRDVPGKLLVIGGGYIGLELGSVYSAFGSAVSVVEFMPALLPGADIDLVKPLHDRLKRKLTKIYLSTKVTEVKRVAKGLRVTFETGDNSFVEIYDKILVSVGRKPNTANLGLEYTGITVDERGFIPVNEQRETAVKGIYAIGDVTGDPMLAHKATAEGKVAAESICGEKAAFDPIAIPAVIFTDPEIAWAGLTEAECVKREIPYKKAEFPWSASGRSLALGRNDGKTKVLGDPETGRILGVAMVGPGAGELIAEGVLGMEMAADMEDLGLTIHPHPTLSETLANAAEVFTGSVTDILQQK